MWLLRNEKTQSRDVPSLDGKTAKVYKVIIASSLCINYAYIAEH